MGLFSATINVFANHQVGADHAQPISIKAGIVSDRMAEVAIAETKVNRAATGLAIDGNDQHQAMALRQNLDVCFFLFGNTVLDVFPDDAIFIQFDQIIDVSFAYFRSLICFVLKIRKILFEFF